MAPVRVINALGKQSPDIAMGVDETADHEQGQATKVDVWPRLERNRCVDARSHHLLSFARKASGRCEKSWHPVLSRPDAKSQVTFRYEEGAPVAIDAVVLLPSTILTSRSQTFKKP